MNKRILVVGIGNQLRQDDGIGPYCIGLLNEIIDDTKKELVDCITVHQLDVIHSGTFAEYQFIIFIDADARDNPGGFILEEVIGASVPQPFTSHIGSIPDIIALTAMLYGKAPRAFLAAVSGSSFEVGEGLTPLGKANAKKVVDSILALTDKLFPLT